MNILIACSKHFYERIATIKTALEQQGHSVRLPNSYDKPLEEERRKQISSEEHQH